MSVTNFRDYNAEYYDLDTTQTDDITFYRNLISTDTKVLELGCGTGRVSIPLASRAKNFVAVDISAAMIARAKEKDRNSKVTFLLHDICDLDLGETFDLIIAPFRVFQALEAREQVDGLMKVIRDHLSPNGLAILNVFNPKYSREEMGKVWCKPGETQYDEFTCSNGDILKTSDLRQKIDPERQVMYPVLIYRRFRNGELIDEHRNPICMKYYYPQEFKDLISDYGFKITQTWGGYRGESYGLGTELVIGFGIGGGDPNAR